MPPTRVAKLFKNGASQAVRLPAEFRFEGDGVYVTRDKQTGDVLLSSRPGAKTWREFFEFIDTAAAPGEFMVERPMNVVPPERDIFGERTSE